MSPALVVVLRVLHIIAGAIWVGGLVIFTFFIMPSISAAGPAGRQVMGELGKRKYPQWIMGFMGITLLSGFALMWWLSQSVGPAYFSSPMGRAISMGAGLAIIASIVGVVVPRPTAMKLIAINEAVQKAGGTPTPEQSAEIARLQKRMILGTRFVAVMLLLAVAAMAGARYMS